MLSEREQIIKENILRSYYRQQRELDQDTAHAFINCLAPARILIGAFSTGEIDKSAFTDTLKQLKDLESKLGKTIDFDPTEYLKQSLNYQQTLRKIKDVPKLRSLFKEKQILLVDDEYKKGWKIVFDCIFGADSCIYAEDSDAAKELLRTHEPTLILLDLKLSSGFEEGLTLLKEIKLNYLYIPVIVFTAYDTSRYVKKCFAYGADNYFAKALYEEEKSYPDYFLKLKEMIFEALKQERKRDIWLSISKLEKNIKEEGPPYYWEALSYLKKAYYGLIMDMDSVVYNILFEKITHFDWVVIPCALSLEFTTTKLLSKHKNHPIITTLFPNIEDFTFGERLRRLREIRVLSKSQYDICNEINELRRLAVHSFPTQRGLRIDEGTAINALSKTIQLQGELIETLRS